MAFLKKGSKVLESAVKRLAAFLSINPDLKLGSKLSVAGYSEAIEKLRFEIQEYNIQLSKADEARHRIKEAEKQLRQMSKDMLLGVALEFGKDSIEYEMIGGVRSSNQKKSIAKETPSVPEATVEPTASDKLLS